MTAPPTIGGPMHHTDPLRAFLDTRAVITDTGYEICGTITAIWRWFTADATGIRVHTDSGVDENIALPDSGRWMIATGDRCRTYRHHGAGDPTRVGGRHRKTCDTPG